MKTTQDDLEVMLVDIEKREGKLSEWELEFVDSVGRRILEQKPLSEKQDEAFCKIWDRVTT